MATTLGCGKTAILVSGSGGSDEPDTGGTIGQGGAVSLGGTISKGGAVSLGGTISKGGAVSLGGTISKGGAVSLGGTIGQGGATASAGTSGHGGATATAGSGGRGGAIATGGTKGSGGSTGQATTIVSPRAPAAHRPQALSCVGVHAPAEPIDVMSGSCKRHADCTNGTNGRCIHGIGSAGRTYYCVYDQCATDSDCDAGKVCYCTATDAARCLSVGNCRSDADCGSGNYSYCSPSNGWDCGGYHVIDSYYCHTPKDTCIDNSDCTGTSYCNYDAVDGRWECTVPNMTCVVG